MLSTIPKLVDKAFIIGFLVPVILFFVALLFLFSDFPWVSDILTQKINDADTDEVGHAFQYDVGHLFRSEVGHHSEMKPATRRVATVGLD